jgi:dTDP-4-dehydrorhamnose 3,5-epimerase-like enzyme
MQGRKRFGDSWRLPEKSTNMTIEKCQLIELPKIKDQRGNLTFIESSRHIPFDIKRVYYLYDVPGGAARAAHGHKKLHQLMVSMSGSFDITLDDGFIKKTFHLNRSYLGLYIPPMIWRDLDNFSSGAVCMVLASDFYDEDDYFRSYADFISVAKKQSSK